MGPHCVSEIDSQSFQYAKIALPPRFSPPRPPRGFHSLDYLPGAYAARSERLARFARNDPIIL